MGQPSRNIGFQIKEDPDTCVAYKVLGFAAQTLMLRVKVPNHYATGHARLRLRAIIAKVWRHRSEPASLGGQHTEGHAHPQLEALGRIAFHLVCDPPNGSVADFEANVPTGILADLAAVKSSYGDRR